MFKKKYYTRFKVRDIITLRNRKSITIEIEVKHMLNVYPIPTYISDALWGLPELILELEDFATHEPGLVQAVIEEFVTKVKAANDGYVMSLWAAQRGERS